MDVKIIKSKNRRKSAVARFEKGEWQVVVPFFLPDKKIVSIVDDFRKRIQRKFAIKNDTFLLNRALILHKKYLGITRRKFAIFWSKRQRKIFGICHQRNNVIRIADRLKTVPKYVLDYVIIHELAHLHQPNHGSNFWQLVKKYPFWQRAKGFLEGWEFGRKA